TTGHGTELARTEHAANGGQADDLLFDLRREHAGEHRTDVVDRFVNDAVITHVHAVFFYGSSRGCIAAHIERDDARLGSGSESDVRLGQATDAGRHDVDGDLTGRQSVQRIAQCFDAALYVGLDQELHQVCLVLAHGREYVLHVGAFLCKFDVARLRLTMHRHFARLTFALHHQQFVTRVRRTRQSQ